MLNRAMVQKELARKAHGQIARRNVDSSFLNITVVGSTIHLSGRMGQLHTHKEVDLKSEKEHITQLLRQISGIRDVIWDVRFDD